MLEFKAPCKWDAPFLILSSAKFMHYKASALARPASFLPFKTLYPFYPSELAHDVLSQLPPFLNAVLASFRLPVLYIHEPSLNSALSMKPSKPRSS